MQSHAETITQVQPLMQLLHTQQEQAQNDAQEAHCYME